MQCLRHLSGGVSPRPDNYEAGLNQVDFGGATEASRQTINLWIEQRTENKIRESLRPGSLASDTRLVLTNAI